MFDLSSLLKTVLAMKPLFRELEDYLVTKRGCANNAIPQLCCDKVASVNGVFVFFQQTTASALWK